MLAHVRSSDATEVELASRELRLRLLRRPGAVPVGPGGDVTASGNHLAEGTPLVAPLTGVFYRAATPGAPPFVEVGDRVEAGAVVGLIETMKIFNEVLAERRGRISAILADSGQLVHAGETLMTIDDAEPVGGQAAP